MKTRIIQTRFWSDGFVSSLTPLEKLIFNYYLTNEKVNIIHCYECPDKYVLVDTGVSKEILVKCKQKLQKAGKLFFYKDYVLLTNAGKYESYKGQQNEIAKEKLFKEMSNDVLDWYNNPFDRGMDTPQRVPINHKPEIINNKSETGVVKGGNLTEEDFEQIATDYKVPVAFVVSKWDDVQNYCNATGKKYKDYKATLRNWVKKDALSLRKEANGKSKIDIVTPDPNWQDS